MSRKALAPSKTQSTLGLTWEDLNSHEMVLTSAIAGGEVYSTFIITAVLDCQDGYSPQSKERHDLNPLEVIPRVRGAVN